MLGRTSKDTSGCESLYPFWHPLDHLLFSDMFLSFGSQVVSGSQDGLACRPLLACV